MAIRDDAYRDWKDGMKYREIAEKYGVSVGTVKSWAARYWKGQDAEKLQPKSEKGCNPQSKRLQPPIEKLQPKKRGGQPGNSNAEGNKGGAPPGNQNSVKHGFYVQALSEEEQALLDGRNVALEDELKDELDLLGIRELRMMRQISAQQNNTTGLAIQSIEKEGSKTTTKAIATTENIKKWEALLTQVQRTRIKGLKDLMVHERAREAAMNEKDDSETGLSDFSEEDLRRLAALDDDRDK